MKIEYCAASPEAVLLAAQYLPDRIELCQSLETGGLTPSPALIRMALTHKLETHVLIRPRQGHFVYSRAEKELMLDEIRLCRDLGVQGIVTGALLDPNALDLDFLEKARELSRGMQMTFHRAIDELSNYEPAVGKLIDLKVDRLLTSGTAPDVEQGATTLKKMLKLAAGRIQLMCGGGINLQNAVFVRDTIRPDAVHFSATKLVGKNNFSGLFSADRMVADAEKLGALMHVFRQKQ